MKSTVSLALFTSCSTTCRFFFLFIRCCCLIEGLSSLSPCFYSTLFSVSILELSNCLKHFSSVTMATTDQISQKGSDGGFKSPSVRVLETFSAWIWKTEKMFPCHVIAQSLAFKDFLIHFSLFVPFVLLFVCLFTICFIVFTLFLGNFVGRLLR